MALQVVEPRIRGYLCTTAHPDGCERHVRRQVEQAHRNPREWPGGKLLVVGASTGYGLASRIAGAFRYGMGSVGVFYERPASGKRTASAGWYNAAAFHRVACEHDLYASSINGDAFSQEILDQALARVRHELGPLDAFVYSLAAPRRTDPDTGEVYHSSLKTTGKPFATKTIELNTGQVVETTIETASEEEIRNTVAVMGGADLKRWVDAFLAEGLLAPGARVVSYSYIGTEATWPIYRHGTIGRAKMDLEATSDELHRLLQERIGGACLVSMNPSVVTQAAMAIPGVPLSMSILFRVMREMGLHEGVVEPIVRLFDDHIGPGRTPTLDAEGRIRLDDVELRDDIQEECVARWERVNTANLHELSDYANYQRYFRQLFGFDLEGVDYAVPVETEVPLD